VPRRKEYVESEVIEAAMNLFWRNGYSNTSARMLEQTMKINLFSIYSSFQNKEGVFLECLKAYKKMNREQLLDRLQQGSTMMDIKQYFLDFLSFTRENDSYKGCLLINSAQELGLELGASAKAEIDSFAMEIMGAFKFILTKESYASDELEKKANYLFVSLLGLITTAKSLGPKQIEDYLDVIFPER